MKKVSIISVLFIVSSFSSTAQENIDKKIQDKRWTINECVNEFSWKDTIQTNVGYQYWFFDKVLLMEERLR